MRDTFPGIRGHVVEGQASRGAIGACPKSARIFQNVVFAWIGEDPQALVNPGERVFETEEKTVHSRHTTLWHFCIRNGTHRGSVCGVRKTAGKSWP